MAPAAWTRKAQETSPGRGADVRRFEGNSLTTPENERSPSDSTLAMPPSMASILSASSSGSDTTRNLFSSPESGASTPSRKLGLLTDKLKLAGQNHAHSLIHKSSSLHPGLLLHPHHISPTSPTSPTFPPSSPTMTSSNKVHTSPSKASYGRTYDSKLVTREMHRLAPSVSSLSLPAPTQASMASASGTDPWGTLHVHILPLFNGEPLRIPIEDLNILVKRHISTAASSPSKALATLEHDTSELIGAGMRTLNAKLAEKEDDKLVGRVVEIWGFFWDQVLPYVEGALLPLQTDPILSSLARQPKRPSSPSRQQTKGSISSLSALSTPQIDVRTVALRSFRDKVILPLAPRLKARLSMTNRQDNFQETPGYQQPRLQQMLLVLASQNRYRMPTFSLTPTPPQPSGGEAAVLELLRILRSPGPQFNSRQTIKPNGQRRAPSFLSGGLPGDRRGRIAIKQKGSNLPTLTAAVVRAPLLLDDDEMSGEETPRLGGVVLDNEREKEREFLESLRSPGLGPGVRGSVGGWGLGAGQEDTVTKEEEEDEPLDWDQAQAVVERMVGMKAANMSDASLSRRR